MPNALPPRGVGRHRRRDRRGVAGTPAAHDSVLGTQPRARADRGDARHRIAIRGERRFGGFAIAAGLFGFGIAFLATLSTVGKLESVVVWSALLAAMLRFATPLAFAALGGMFSERSGVVNIGLEGMMLMARSSRFHGGDKLDSWWLGLLIGILAAASPPRARLLEIHYEPTRSSSGTAINFLAFGLTGLPVHRIYGTEGDADRHPQHPECEPLVHRRGHADRVTSSGLKS
jgi:hypothetical protein